VKSPADEWESLMMELRDLVIRSVRLGVRVGENNGFGESVLMHDQYLKAEKICEKATMFLKARVENAKGQAGRT